MEKIELQDAGYNLLIPFIDESESFTLGWECGQIYYSLVDKGCYKGLAHTKNIPQIQIITNTLKCFTKITPIPNIEDEWVEVDIRKARCYIKEEL